MARFNPKIELTNNNVGTAEKSATLSREHVVATYKSTIHHFGGSKSANFYDEKSADSFESVRAAKQLKCIMEYNCSPIWHQLNQEATTVSTV